MHNLCKCGHTIEDHTVLSREEYDWFSSYVGSCRHDRAYFKGMCICSQFQEVDNLTQIELLAKQRGLV